MTASLDQRFADAMGQLCGPDFPSDIALAVSGGGDSMAMLTLAHNWARVWGVRLWVVTVDHGLRAESAAEAAMVADECAVLGHPHATLIWHWDGQGNLQAAARDARLHLINQWRGALTHVLMAHTQDDVAETFLSRLSRQAGVEGLSAMQDKRRVELLGPVLPLPDDDCVGALPPPSERGIRPGWFDIIRPCLAMSRAELRHYLKTLHGRWVEDPSNEDPRFDRVRMRNVMVNLDEAGVPRDRLSQAARRMARASAALRARALDVWQQIGQEPRVGHTPTGEILLARTEFERIERETQLRLLSYALAYTATRPYRPREEPLDALLDRLLAGGGGTLHGCEARMERDTLRVFREYQAVAERQTDLGAKDGSVTLWDGRWKLPTQAVADKDRPRAAIRALGDDGWAQAKDRMPEPPPGAPPFHSARSLPSLWVGDTLHTCDGLGLGQGHTALWPMGRELHSFNAYILSH